MKKEEEQQVKERKDREVSRRNSWKMNKLVWSKDTIML